MADSDDDSPKEKRASGFQLWFEEAWEGWIRPLGLIFLMAIAYVLYKFDLITEGLAGGLLVVGIILGSLAAGLLPAWPLVRAPGTRVLYFAMAALALVGTGYPAVRSAFPPGPLADAHLTSDSLSKKVKVASDGPYELAVSGRFKHAGASDAEASYTIKVQGGGHTDEVSGALKRSMVRVRVGRKGGTSQQLQEHTELAHRLPTVRGGELDLSVDGVDEQLEDGLFVMVRPGGPNPILFVVLGAMSLLLALGLDARLREPSTVEKKAKSGKAPVKTYLTAALAVAFVFSINFPMEATPHSLVRPAVGALVLGLLVGGGGGWVLGSMARVLFGPPRPKKATARR